MSDTDFVPPDFDVDSVSFEPATEAPARTRKPRADKGVARGARGSTGPRTSSAKDKKLAEDLLSPWAIIVQAVSMVLPTLGYVMTQQADKTMTAIVAVASPKMKEAFAKASKVGPSADLLQAVAMMIVAAAVDLNKLDPDSPVVKITGVREAFDATHEAHVEESASPFSTTTNNFAPFPTGV